MEKLAKYTISIDDGMLVSFKAESIEEAISELKRFFPDSELKVESVTEV